MAYELIKVSELPELTTPSDPNVIPIQDGDYLKRISFEKLKEAVTGDIADDLAAETQAREQAIQDEAQARENADDAILADLAAEYDATAIYAVGDYCIHEGQLQRCIVPITTAEAWTASHWTAVALGDDVSDLKNALNSYCGIEERAFTNQEGRKYINGAGVVTSASGTLYVTNPIPVSAGEEIHFIATGGTSSFTMIATCDSTGSSIISQTRAIYDGQEHDYVYNVLDDGYIMLSYNFSKSATLIVLKSKSNNVLETEINKQTWTIKTFCGTEQIAFSVPPTKRFISGTGVITEASGTYHVTDPVPVSAGDEVHFIARGNTSNFTMIATCDSEGGSITVKVGALSDGAEHDYVYSVVADGYVMLGYNFSYDAKLVVLTALSNVKLAQRIESIEATVGAFDGVCISTNGNLINHRDMTDSKAMSENGTVSDNTEYAITGEILLKPSTTYSYRNLYRINYFDSNNAHITPASNLYGNETGTFTAPSNVKYGVVTIHKPTDPSGTGTVFNDYTWQLVEGSTLPDYEQQVQILNGYNIINKNPVIGGVNYAFRRWNKTCFDKMPVFLATAESDAVTSEDKNSAAILAKYDALASANPEYITKTSIGTASNGETMYRYDFKLPTIRASDGTAFDKATILPKIICISGVHPEYGGIYGLYNAMREITTNSDLVNLKNGVHFIVVPVANPYGIANNTRTNANDIDMARNYEIDYVSNSGSKANGTWSGLTALSEVEPQIIDGIMKNNADAILFMSCHSFQADAKKRVMWGSCATKYMANIVGKTGYKLTEAWKEKYPNFDWDDEDTAEVLTILTLATEPGSEGKQATKYAIQGLTLETSDYFSLESASALTSFVISRNCETYINFIRTALGCWESSDPKDMSIFGNY